MATNCKIVFISYNSTKDKEVKEFVKQLKTKLESDGCDKAFIFQSPEDNRPGVNWPDNLAERIESCDAFLAVITQGYLDSDICSDEFHAALHKKLLIPIIFEDRKPDFSQGISKHGPAIKMGASSINRVSFQKPEIEESPYNDLLIGLGLKEALPGTEETDIGSTPGTSNEATPETHQSSDKSVSLKIFQSYSAKLRRAFAADPPRVASELHSAFLIEFSIKNDVRTLTGTAHDKADLLVDNLQMKLENNDNPDDFLRKICDCLQYKIKDNVINKIGADMRKSLGK